MITDQSTVSVELALPLPGLAQVLELEPEELVIGRQVLGQVVQEEMMPPGTNCELWLLKATIWSE